MTARMTFGYLYDFRNPEPWRRPSAELYAETLDFIAWSETVGFEGAWVPEHHGAEDGYVPSPLVMLSAIAARTRTLTLGTGIALATLYHPLRFAEDSALVDIVSGGRLEIGLAIGYRTRETDAYGVPFVGRGRRADEFIGLVKRLWAGETVTHAGEHFQLKDAQLAPRPVRGHIPLFVGGFTQRALERAAEFADGYDGAVSLYPALQEKLAARGRDPARMRLRVNDLMLFVARDPEKAAHELAPHLHYVNNAYGRWIHQEGGSAGRTLFRPMSLEEFKASGTMHILTPEQAIARLEKLRARGPVEHLTMAAPPGLPFARFAEYAELFAKEVAPAFR
jgi:alkanesulfonate monooxygenase SsuD/methylene tetrahydromethanopterin reductase-like flavin-dependent oxidoreductase (luciferase family)